MKFLVPIFLFFAFACSAPKSLEKCDLIITNATIVDAKKDQIRGSKWVAISEDVIVATGDMDAMPWEAAKQIDAEGQYLMPGLWDNHVHFRGGDSLIEENKALLSHFLSHVNCFKQDISCPSTYCFMCFNPTKTCILVSGIAKAGY